MPAECITRKNNESNQNENTNSKSQASRKATSILIAFLLSIMIVVTFCTPLNNAFARENVASDSVTSIATVTTQNAEQDAQLATLCNTPLDVSLISGNTIAAYAVIVCCGVCVLLLITNAVLNTKLKKVSEKHFR